MRRRLRFALMYLGQPRWDTGITPPEVVALIEDQKLPPGRALDLGCGTGTNSLYLARHGWQVTGLDFVPRAVRKARAKARAASLRQSVTFKRADVSQLEKLKLPPVDFALDIGCMHSLTPEQQAGYAQGLATVVRPGGTYLVYAARPREGRTGPLGLTPEAIEGLFQPYFQLVFSEDGYDDAGVVNSGWYRFERKD